MTALAYLPHSRQLPTPSLRGLMGAWTITCDDVVIRALPTHQSPMVELDVVRRRLTLGSGAPNAGDSALQTGALVRRFLEAQDVDWTDALTWAQAADDLLQLALPGFGLAQHAAVVGR